VVQRHRTLEPLVVQRHRTLVPLVVQRHRTLEPLVVQQHRTLEVPPALQPPRTRMLVASPLHSLAQRHHTQEVHPAPLLLLKLLLLLQPHQHHCPLVGRSSEPPMADFTMRIKHKAAHSGSAQLGPHPCPQDGPNIPLRMGRNTTATKLSI